MYMYVGFILVGFKVFHSIKSILKYIFQLINVNRLVYTTSLGITTSWELLAASTSVFVPSALQTLEILTSYVLCPGGLLLKRQSN